MTLDDLITNLNACDPDEYVRFVGAVRGNPDSFHSWRGVYAHLALDIGDYPIKVSELLDRAAASKNETFEGYKGGDFYMTGDTPVWASEYGSAQHNAIVGVDHSTSPVALLTHNIEEYVF